MKHGWIEPTRVFFLFSLVSAAENAGVLRRPRRPERYHNLENIIIGMEDTAGLLLWLNPTLCRSINNNQHITTEVTVFEDGPDDSVLKKNNTRGI